MKTRNKLFLHEEIMLMALKEREGTIVSGTNYSYALGGAILAELLLHKRIIVEAEKKKKFAKVIDSLPMGEPLLSECLEKINTAKKRQQLQTWVTRFAQIKNLKHRVAKQLTRRGILRADEDKILHIFTRKIYPEIDPRPEQDLIERLRQAIFTDSDDIDPKTVVLLSLAKSTELLKVVFDKKQLKTRKERIEQIVNGEMMGKAAKEAVDAAMAAVMVATIIPAVIVTTTSAH